MSNALTQYQINENLAWRLYLREQRINTVDVNRVAHEGSKFSYTSWASLPRHYQLEYLSRVDTLSKRLCNIRDDIANDLTNERIKQVIKWGGIEHDVKHTNVEWLAILEDIILYDEDPIRPVLIKIAATAIAAIGAIEHRDRE